MKLGNHEITFEEKIIRLISFGHEGEFWDFKREWYNNNTELLFDIICMANNLHNSDAYIIIGVDEENGYEIRDIENDPGRKSTQNIVDILKDKKFAGGVRPLVRVEQLYLDDCNVDVIVIENSFNTPFYLTEPYQGIRANHIYTRVMDTNTAKDKSADINNVEYLWRKRFRLNSTPLEQIQYYLQNPKDWQESPLDYEMTYYYKKSPEFIIKEESDDTRTGYEFYLFSQVDSTPHWYMVTLYYHQTALEQFQGLALDGGRYFVITPNSSGISFSEYGHWDICYKYYDTTTLRYDLLCFYHKDTQADYEYDFHKYMECILMFSSEHERKEFETFVKNNEDKYHTLYTEQSDTNLPYFPEIKGYNMDTFKKQYKDAFVLKSLLSKFRETQ